AGGLEPGDELRREDGSRSWVRSASERAGTFAVFNLEVAEVHTYFAAGVLVHNGNDCVGGGASKGSGGARFIGEPNGTLVDTVATPPGSYKQPGRAVAKPPLAPTSFSRRVITVRGRRTRTSRSSTPARPARSTCAGWMKGSPSHTTKFRTS
ncbi:MAG: hypothetical protein ABMA64_10185, partial [Myxococcota bacterium]